MQNVQDFLARALDVALVSVYNKHWLTEPSNTTILCSSFIKRSKIGYKRCEKCHELWENEAKKRRKPIIFKCHAGLTNFAVPVIIENTYFACVLGGQVVTTHPSEDFLLKTAREIEIDEDSYLKEFKNMKYLSDEKINQITDLLFLITNSIAINSYINHKLAKGNANYKAPKNSIIDEWLSKDCNTLKRPISTREHEVLKLIIAGKSNTEIAKELFISVHTVKAHVSSILEKFGVEDRVQVAVKAVREGLI